MYFRLINRFIGAFGACLLLYDTQAETPAVVLDSQQVIHSDGSSTIINRIAPPPQRSPAVEAPVSTRLKTPLPSPQVNSSLNQHTLLLAATVFDEDMTRIEWSFQGTRLTFWSQIDGNHLQHLTSFSVGDASYFVIPMVNHATHLTQAPPREFDRYQLIKPTVLSLEARKILDDLHAYYTQHRDALAEADRIHQAKRIADPSGPNSSQPPVHTVNFWKIQ